MGRGWEGGWLSDFHTKSRNLYFNHKQREDTTNTNIHNTYILNAGQKQCFRPYSMECGRGGWMGGRAPDFHPPQNEVCFLHVLLLSVELRWVGRRFWTLPSFDFCFLRNLSTYFYVCIFKYVYVSMQHICIHVCLYMHIYLSMLCIYILIYVSISMCSCFYVCAS